MSIARILPTGSDDRFWFALVVTPRLRAKRLGFARSRRRGNAGDARGGDHIRRVAYLAPRPCRRRLTLRPGIDRDRADTGLRLGTDKVDMEQAVIQPCALDLNSLGENEGAVELARCDASIEEHPALRVLGLPAADDELIVLVRDLEVFHAEASHGEAYAEARGTRLLDIFRRVPRGVRLGNA